MLILSLLVVEALLEYDSFRRCGGSVKKLRVLVGLLDFLEVVFGRGRGNPAQLFQTAEEVISEKEREPLVVYLVLVVGMSRAEVQHRSIRLVCHDDSLLASVCMGHILDEWLHLTRVHIEQVY